VRFRRSSGMQPLPVPIKGGKIADLRPFLNVKTKSDFELAVSWEQAAYRHHGPYPVLVLAGEQGTGKTTLSGIMKSMLDPNTAPLRALPRSVHRRQ
jgi:pantothenate kinase-related protein Tda10